MPVHIFLFLNCKIRNTWNPECKEMGYNPFIKLWIVLSLLRSAVQSYPQWVSVAAVFTYTQATSESRLKVKRNWLNWCGLVGTAAKQALRAGLRTLPLNHIYSSLDHKTFQMFSVTHSQSLQWPHSESNPTLSNNPTQRCPISVSMSQKTCVEAGFHSNHLFNQFRQSVWGSQRTSHFKVRLKIRFTGRVLDVSEQVYISINALDFSS